MVAIFNSGETTTVKSVGVRGFKSIKDLSTVEIGGLTILSGANSSGKSSFMQPFLLLKQTRDKVFDPPGLDISGPNASFSSAAQMLSSFGNTSLDSYSILFLLSNGDSIELNYRRNNGVFLDSAKYCNNDRNTSFTINESFDPIKNDKISPIKNNIDDMFLKIVKVFEKQKPLISVEARRGFPAFCLRNDMEKNGTAFIEFKISDEVEEFISTIIHVPGLRGNPERNYSASFVGERFPGLFTEYVASVIHGWKQTKDVRLQSLGKLLLDLGLTWKVDTRQVDDTKVEIRVARLPKAKQGGAHDMVSIADVGFGVSQVLPILVALLVARSGQVVYIEQPEIHLHPRAQVALGKIVSDAAKRGVRVIVETLSSSFILSIQTLVAEGYMSNSQVKMHWFSRGSDGWTNTVSASLDEDGSYGSWPEDFGSIDMELEMRFLNAASK